MLHQRPNPVNLTENIYHKLLALQTSFPSDARFLSAENLEIIQQLCNLYDNIEHYLPPDDREKINNVIEIKKQKKLGGAKIKDDVLKLGKEVMSGVMVEHRIAQYHYVKHWLDENCEQLSDEHESIKAKWLLRSRFANTSSDTLIQLIKTLERFDEYREIALADVIDNKNTEFKSQTSSLMNNIGQVVQQARRELAQTLLDRISLISTFDLMAIAEGSTNSDEHFYDDVVFDTIKLLENAKLLNQRNSDALKKKAPSRATLTAEHVKQANTFITKYGTPEQKQILSHLFDKNIPLEQSGHKHIMFDVGSLTESFIDIPDKEKSATTAQDEMAFMESSIIFGDMTLDDALLKYIADKQRDQQSDRVMDELENLYLSQSETWYNSLTKSFVDLRSDKDIVRDAMHDLWLMNLPHLEGDEFSNQVIARLQGAITSHTIDAIHKQAYESYANVLADLEYPSLATHPLSFRGEKTLFEKTIMLMLDAHVPITDDTIKLAKIKSQLVTLLSQEYDRIYPDTQSHSVLFPTATVKSLKKCESLELVMMQLIELTDVNQLRACLSDILSNEDLLAPRGLGSSTLKAKLNNFFLSHFQQSADEWRQQNEVRHKFEK